MRTTTRDPRTTLQVLESMHHYQAASWLRNDEADEAEQAGDTTEAERCRKAAEFFYRCYRDERDELISRHPRVQFPLVAAARPMTEAA